MSILAPLCGELIGQDIDSSALVWLFSRHFVLVTGTDKVNATKLYVNDPGFYRASYDWTQVGQLQLSLLTGFGEVKAVTSV